MFAEWETDRNLVGIIVDGAYNVRTLVGAAGTGAAAAGADIVDVEIEKNHFAFLCFGKTGAEYRIQTSPQWISVERNGNFSQAAASQTAAFMARRPQIGHTETPNGNGIRASLFAYPIEHDGSLIDL